MIEHFSTTLSAPLPLVSQSLFLSLQVSTLENKIKEMEAQIKLLSQKSETSEKSVKDIALKAIESSTKVQFVEKERVTKE